MKIAICASLKCHDQIIIAKHKLEDLGHTVILPWTTELIYKNKMTFKDIPAFKKKNKSHAVVLHFDKIKQADAVLVVNPTRKRIKNYIGGNTLMEMGFAYYSKKPIYLLNPIPKMIYTEEIQAMKPVILNNKLNKINLDL